jgi:hypothetical protein
VASEVPPAHAAARSGSSWSRGWIRFDDYRLIHDRYIEVLYRDGYVDSSSLSFSRIIAADGSVAQVVLEGVIRCSDDVAIDVTKFMDVRRVDGRLEVISTYYRYQAWRPGRNGEPLLRYDQAHDSAQPHYHRFSETGALVRYDDLTLDSMPRLDAVVREAVDLARERDARARQTREKES